METDTKTVRKCSEKETAVCPFNPKHVMPAQTLQAHLGKCTYKTKEFSQCIYNPLHWVKSHMRQEHEKKCESRKQDDKSDDDQWAAIGEEIKQNNKIKREERKNEKKEVEVKVQVEYKKPNMKELAEKNRKNNVNIKDFLDEGPKDEKKQGSKAVKDFFESDEEESVNDTKTGLIKKEESGFSNFASQKSSSQRVEKDKKDKQKQKEKEKEKQKQGEKSRVLDFMDDDDNDNDISRSKQTDMGKKQKPKATNFLDDEDDEKEQKPQKQTKPAPKQEKNRIEQF